jgi:hypothetical protein
VDWENLEPCQPWSNISVGESTRYHVIENCQ